MNTKLLLIAVLFVGFFLGVMWKPYRITTVKLGGFEAVVRLNSVTGNAVIAYPQESVWREIKAAPTWGETQAQTNLWGDPSVK